MKNTFFKTYITMVTGYLNRCYDSVKNVIEEDSKYDIVWVFMVVKYKK